MTTCLNRSFFDMKCLLLLFSISILPSAVHAATIYSVDDGTAETSVGHGNFGDFMWGNYFTVVPGGNIVTELEIAFSSSGVSVGTAFEALVYEDLDDDGDPTTGLSLLTRLNSTVQNPQSVPGAMTFETHDIPDTVVSGGFFIAVFMAGTNNPYPAPFDQTSDAGVGWFAENDTTGALDTNDPFGTATLSGQPASFGLPGNFLVRAMAIPEPGSALLIGAGLIALAMRQRK